MTIYYRLAGIDAVTNGWFGYDTKALARVIFESLAQGRSKKNVFTHDQKSSDRSFSGIELVLGILPSGASYLLAIPEQMQELLSHRHLQGCRLWADNAQYLSFSPIRFESFEELHEKIKKYSQKSKKKAVRKQDNVMATLDTSVANKVYNMCQNLSRAAFENQRTLWTAIAGVINAEKFNMPQLPTWLASTPLVALVPDTWLKDDYLKSQSDPTILKLHLASIDCMCLADANYTPKMIDYNTVKIRETKARINAVDIYKSHHQSSANAENSETMKSEELGTRLRKYLSSIDSKISFLLVYDATRTFAALRKLGVDVSEYNESMYSLLHGDGASVKRSEELEDRKTFDRGANEYASLSRRRSLSPRRRDSLPPRARSPMEERSGTTTQMPKLEDTEGDEQEDDDEQVPPPSKIFVIDAKAMFLAMSALNERSLKDLRDMGRHLDIPYDRNDGPSNACELLIEAWRRMASGRAIDEQYKECWSRVVPSYEKTIRPKAQAWIRPAGDDYDPNDVDTSQLQNERSVVRAGPSGYRPPVDSSDEDE